jgi:hypothetical protein
MSTRKENQDWKLMGLSSADVFYSYVKYWLNTRNDGLNAFSEALKSHKSIHAAFGVAYLMLSAIHCAREGHGNSESGIELLSSEVARNSIIDVFDIIREFVSRGDSNDAIEYLFKINEGKRLYELCRLLLQSYATEAKAQGNNEDGSQSNENFKQSYHNAKQRCIDIFILLKAPSHAFKLARKYYYFKGLLEATESDESLYDELSAVVSKDFNIRGTENDPLGTYCMKWFEQKNQIPAILKFGMLEEPETKQLQSFLETRPHVAWLHQIAKSSYSDASRSLYKSAFDNSSSKKVLIIFFYYYYCYYHIININVISLLLLLLLL